MFTKEDSEFLKSKVDTKIDNQPTKESTNLTNKEEVSDFNTDIGQSNFSEFDTDVEKSDVDFGFEEKSQNMSTSMSSITGDIHESWADSNRNRIIGAVSLAALFLIGLTIYHFQGQELEHTSDQELVESSFAGDEDQDFSSEEGVLNSIENSASNISEEQVYSEEDNLDNENQIVDTYESQGVQEQRLGEESEQSAQAIVNTEPYRIVKGDWLSKIAQRRLGDAMLWPKVWVLNPQIENPHLIYPGDVITVPTYTNKYAESTPYIN